MRRRNLEAEEIMKKCVSRNLQGFMASDPIPQWQIDGEKVETVADFI